MTVKSALQEWKKRSKWLIIITDEAKSLWPLIYANKLSATIKCDESIKHKFRNKLYSNVINIFLRNQILLDVVEFNRSKNFTFESSKDKYDQHQNSSKGLLLERYKKNSLVFSLIMYLYNSIIFVTRMIKEEQMANYHYGWSQIFMTSHLCW